MHCRPGFSRKLGQNLQHVSIKLQKSMFTCSKLKTKMETVFSKRLKWYFASKNSQSTKIYTGCDPVNSCSSGFRPELDELFDSQHAIIMGDFNAHHSTWRSALAQDTKSQLLADTLDSKTCVVLNGDASNGTLSSPDITIASASLATTANWSTETALNSDHKPIIVELQIQEPTVNSERRKYMNFAKADWAGFKSFMEDSIWNLPQGDLLQSERAFRNKMQKAAR